MEIEKKITQKGDSLYILIPSIIAKWLDLKKECGVLLTTNETDGVKKIILTKKINGEQNGNTL